MTDRNNYINKMTAAREASFGVGTNILPSGKISGVFELGGSRT